jgi:hypothetical protein
LNLIVALIDELFEDEGEEAYLVRVIHDELEAGRHADLTFNIYSLQIDPDAGSVTVSDLFDRSEVMAIEDLRAALRGRPMAAPLPPPPPGMPLGPTAGE